MASSLVSQNPRKATQATIDPLRSSIMRAVRSKDTLPELRVRSFIHSLGCRFRLHRKDLPGCPDLVFPATKKALFVHGCFWHGHQCKRGNRVPKTRTEYWTGKISRNRERDVHAIGNLRALGWTTMLIWECELQADFEAVQGRIRKFLSI